MPLFNSSNDSARRSSGDGQSNSPTRKKSIFSSDRNSPPQSTGSGSGSGFFQRRRSSSGSEGNNNTKKSGFFGIGRNNDIENDPMYEGWPSELRAVSTTINYIDFGLIVIAATAKNLPWSAPVLSKGHSQRHRLR